MTSGYRADLAAVDGAVKALRAAVDAVEAAVGHLDGAPCGRLGPGRLPGVAADHIREAARQLGDVGATLTDAGRLLGQSHDEYARADQTVVDLLRKAGGA